VILENLLGALRVRPGEREAIRQQIGKAGRCEPRDEKDDQPRPENGPAVTKNEACPAFH
jgi:hypothetical protein